MPAWQAWSHQFDPWKAKQKQKWTHHEVSCFQQCILFFLTSWFSLVMWLAGSSSQGLSQGVGHWASCVHMQRLNRGKSISKLIWVLCRICLIWLFHCGSYFCSSFDTGLPHCMHLLSLSCGLFIDSFQGFFHRPEERIFQVSLR